MAQDTVPRTGISLRQLLPDGQFVGATDVVVRSCCGRWTDCRTDDLFVAMIDCEGDGHDHVAQALDRGACGVVGERLLAIPKPQCIVDDTRQAFGQICHRLAGNPARHLNVIGVTGSLGKTVTSHLIRSILQTAHEPTDVLSSLEPKSVGLVSGDFRPEAAGLARGLSAMSRAGFRHAVVEAPSVSLARHGFAGTELNVAVITNIRREHLDYHTTVANYRAAKARLLDYLSPSGFVIINADDPVSAQLLDEIAAPTLTIGLRNSAEITAQILESHPTEQTFLLRAGQQAIPVRVPMIGAHHVYNCLSAAATALVLGIDLPHIARGLEAAGAIPGRLEAVQCGQPFQVYVDAARTPQQLAQALHAVRQVTDRRVICLATHHADDSDDDRQRIGRVVERGADLRVLTSEFLSPADDFEPYHQILDGMREVRSPHIVPDRIRAIEFALGSARPGDAVLIGGCGERPIAAVGDEAWQLTDRDVCQAWLYDQASRPDNPCIPTYRIDDYRGLNS